MRMEFTYDRTPHLVLFQSRCTGKERDQESGNDYFGARYYGSSMGRFLSPDDVGGHIENPQTLNLYSYVANNPLSRTDPTGHDFYQSCQQQSATCGSQNIGNDTHGNAINQLVSGTTDANGKFTATVITSASLGQAGSGNTATVDGTGVHITTGTGTDNRRQVKEYSSLERQQRTSRVLVKDGISSISISMATMSLMGGRVREPPHTSDRGDIKACLMQLTAWLRGPASAPFIIRGRIAITTFIRERPMIGSLQAITRKSSITDHLLTSLSQQRRKAGQTGLVLLRFRWKSKLRFPYHEAPDEKLLMCHF